MKQFQNCFLGRRILLTGHTGFKGSWLALWLTELGAQVTGLSLSPVGQLNHWNMLGLTIDERILDIRNASSVRHVVEDVRPEIVFHLAAQPLVRKSYDEPCITWDTNVMGTVNLLEACRLVNCVRAIVVVTTDKVYLNQEWAWGYRETDRLGGYDPYSASKAAVELVVESYRKSFYMMQGFPLIATARAGNVIGGGDWSEDRLVPDLIRSIEARQTLQIRSPLATRPWQHVLECLSGYLLLGQKLFAREDYCDDSWNFGPSADSNCSVVDFLKQISAYWPELAWDIIQNQGPHEANFLYLDTSKVRVNLGWKSVWNLAQAIVHTTDWYHAFFASRQINSREQLRRFISDAQVCGCIWIES